MAAGKRTAVEISGWREGTILAATLGGQVRAARTRRHLTQAALGRRVGLRITRISEIERGEGGGLPLRTWVALGHAVGMPLAVSFSRPLEPASGGPADAGHLAIQELILARAAGVGRTATFELPTPSADPTRSIDVCLRDDRQRCLIVVEVWNDMRDVGAATRSFRRKLAEAEGLAVAIAASPPHVVRGCWVIRSSARNRALLAQYPHVFDSVLPGSSRRWRAALDVGEVPPDEPGIVWCDPATGRIFARRRQQVEGREVQV